MLKSLLTIFVFASLAMFSQKDPAVKDSIFTVIEEMPNYPGGFIKMKEFIDKNIVIPPNSPKGKLYIKFIVDKTGKVTNPQILKSLNPACDKAAIDVVLKLQKFSIPKHNGNPVDCPFSMPIEFK
jgi:protein TonB